MAELNFSPAVCKSKSTAAAAKSSILPDNIFKFFKALELGNAPLQQASFQQKNFKFL